MTITRIGSTEQYAANWARAFGENKRGKATAATATKTVRAKPAKKSKAAKAVGKSKKK